MSAASILSPSFLTDTINAIKSPNSFLKNLLYPASVERAIPLERVEIPMYERGRVIAPFVRRGAEGIMVGGTTSKTIEVEAPNIRIKRPFTGRALMYTRRPGQPIYRTSNAEMIKYAREQMLRELTDLADSVTNAEEWLVAMSLQGVITYSVPDGDHFTITYPRSASNNITLSTFWNDVTPANVKIFTNILSAKRVASVDGHTLTDGICGSEAAAALVGLVEGGNVKMLGSDGTNVSAGDVSFVEQFRNDGAIYLGKLGGIRFWEYARTGVLNDTTVDLIRPKYVEFITTSPTADRQMIYAAIDDMDAIAEGLVVRKRFAKSWTVPDPSATMALVQSKPLPIPRQLNASVSMKVVSG